MRKDRLRFEGVYGDVVTFERRAMQEVYDVPYIAASDGRKRHGPFAALVTWVYHCRDGKHDPPFVAAKEGRCPICGHELRRGSIRTEIVRGTAAQIQASMLAHDAGVV